MVDQSRGQAVPYRVYACGCCGIDISVGPTECSGQNMRRKCDPRSQSPPTAPFGSREKNVHIDQKKCIKRRLDALPAGSLFAHVLFVFLLWSLPLCLYCCDRRSVYEGVFPFSPSRKLVFVYISHSVARIGFVSIPIARRFPPTFANSSAILARLATEEDGFTFNSHY